MGLFKLMYGARMKQLAGLPGPTPSFPMGTAMALAGKEKPWDVCAGYGQKYGGMTLIWIAGEPAIVLNDAGLIGEVLDTNSQDYYKKAPHKALLPITGPKSLFLANGEAWKKRREGHPFAHPDFDSWLAGQVPGLRQLIAERITQLAAESARDDISPRGIDLLGSLQRLSFDAFCQATFGELLGDVAYDDFLYLAGVGTSRMTAPVILSFPLRLSFSSRLKRWNDAINAVMKRREADPSGDDLMSFALRGSHSLPAEEIGSLAGNAVFAGVFSMNSAVLSALYYLQQMEKAASWLAEERQALADTIDDLDAAALADCTKIDYLAREAMRINPPVPLYFRNVLKDQPTELGGHKLPADTTIFITNVGLQHSAEHWENPHDFDPSRWENGVADANPVGSGYFFPFGRGPRECVGLSYAMTYIKLCLATILANHDVAIDTSKPLTQRYFFAVQIPELWGHVRQQDSTS